MNINLQVSESSISENFLVKIFQVELDGTLSDLGLDVTLTVPHTAPVWVPFTGLDKVTHQIKVIGVTSGTVWSTYQKTPTVDVVTIFDFIRFKIGDGGDYTPAVGDASYVNPNMAGMEAGDYVAMRSGYGVAFEGIHIDNDPDGGFILHTVGDVFSDGEEWTIIPKNEVVQTPVNDSVVGKQWGATPLNANMYVDVTSSVNYAPAHLRKLVRLAGASAVYTFSSGDVPPVGYPFFISNLNSNGTTSPLPKVVFSNAPLKYGSSTVSNLSLPFGYVGIFVWDGTIWNMASSAPHPSIIPTFTRGTTAIGDIIGSKVQTITIPNQGGTNYHVTLTVLSNGTPDVDNDVIVMMGATKTSTSFTAIFQETFAAAQNISLDWLITNFG